MKSFATSKNCLIRLTRVVCVWLYRLSNDILAKLFESGQIATHIHIHIHKQNAIYAQHTTTRKTNAKDKLFFPSKGRLCSVYLMCTRRDYLQFVAHFWYSLILSLSFSLSLSTNRSWIKVKHTRILFWIRLCMFVLPSHTSGWCVLLTRIV